jgi:hypothetical protein
MAKGKKPNRRKGAKNKKLGKKAEQYVLLRVPNPYTPNISGTIHAVGTKSEVINARRGLAINSMTKLALLKVVSIDNYKPSVTRVNEASFVDPKKPTTPTK